MQVYIQDPDFNGTFGKPDLQFSLLADFFDHFPPLIEGSTMRIKHMAMQHWQGEMTGRVYDARSVTVFKNDDLNSEWLSFQSNTYILAASVDLPTGDEVVPISALSEERVVFTEKDKAVALELREWWRKRLLDSIAMTDTQPDQENAEEEEESQITIPTVKVP